ncbi:hypothetical protein N7492_009695 [Penicillium capsulatum]|uniref:Uncharacterized protein n=1 Tax=Penicillium capsulatum TaxID=69766 RepID=A0A9W9HUU1_9EURO|nr:hypothetical protein N7492_009695 [Penicillium capsulatum]KAJ6107081.1 hypothetical protein N7512_010598 [Penicillium capsulatum]
MLFAILLVALLPIGRLFTQGHVIHRRADRTADETERAIWRLESWAPNGHDEDSHLPPVQGPSDPYATVQRIFESEPIHLISKGRKAPSNMACDMRFYDDLADKDGNPNPYSVGTDNSRRLSSIFLVTATEGFWFLDVPPGYEKRTLKDRSKNPKTRMTAERLRRSNIFKWMVGDFGLGLNVGKRPKQTFNYKPLRPTLPQFLSGVKKKGGKPIQLAFITAPEEGEGPFERSVFAMALAGEIWDALIQSFPHTDIEFKRVEMSRSDIAAANWFGLNTFHGAAKGNPDKGQFIAAYYGSSRLVAAEFPDSSRHRASSSGDEITVDLTGDDGSSSMDIDFEPTGNRPIDLPIATNRNRFTLPLERLEDTCNIQGVELSEDPNHPSDDTQLTDFDIQELDAQLGSTTSIQLGEQDQPKVNILSWAPLISTATFNNGPDGGKNSLFFAVVSSSEAWTLPVPRTYIGSNRIGRLKSVPAYLKNDNFLEFAKKYLGDPQGATSDPSTQAEDLKTVLQRWKDNGEKKVSFAMIIPFKEQSAQFEVFAAATWEWIAHLVDQSLGPSPNEVARIHSALKSTTDDNLNLRILSSYQLLDGNVPGRFIEFQYARGERLIKRITIQMVNSYYSAASSRDPVIEMFSRTTKWSFKTAHQGSGSDTN